MSNPKETIRVTDHAVLRYMERAMGLNVEIVREHIATLCAGPAACGASALRAEGVKFEIAGKAVVTVVPDTGTHINKTTRERNQHAIKRKKEDVHHHSPAD